MLRPVALDNVLAFTNPVPYSEEEVARLAPAVWLTGWLAVDAIQSPGKIWGIGRGPLLDRLGIVVVDVSDPGCLRVGFGPVPSFVVFAGRSATLLHGASDIGLTARLGSVLGKDLSTTSAAGSRTPWRECMALGILAGR
jgi:hypothetical protein